jgi:acyl-CoA reductase-like NAD-dependent aldehyde dehydrogenase
MSTIPDTIVRDWCVFISGIAVEPTPGVKSSGVGREESAEELLSYTETKKTTIVFS